MKATVVTMAQIAAHPTQRVDPDYWLQPWYCHDPRHGEPCQLPCGACDEECDPAQRRPRED